MRQTHAFVLVLVFCIASAPIRPRSSFKNSVRVGATIKLDRRAGKPLKSSINLDVACCEYAPRRCTISTPIPRLMVVKYRCRPRRLTGRGSPPTTAAPAHSPCPAPGPASAHPIPSWQLWADFVGHFGERCTRRTMPRAFHVELDTPLWSCFSIDNRAIATYTFPIRAHGGGQLHTAAGRAMSRASPI